MLVQKVIPFDVVTNLIDVAGIISVESLMNKFDKFENRWWRFSARNIRDSFNIIEIVKVHNAIIIFLNAFNWSDKIHKTQKQNPKSNQTRPNFQEISSITILNDLIISTHVKMLLLDTLGYD